MTNEELVARIKDGETELMGELYTQNIRLIHMLARKLCPNIDDYEDAMQDAYFGLAAAVETYDKDKGTKFMTHAVQHIKNAIRRGKCTAKHIPEYMAFRAAHIRKAENVLSLQLGRAPTVAEISHKANMTVEEIRSTINAIAPVKSIYDTLGAEDLTISDTIQDCSIDIEKDVADSDVCNAVHKAVNDLPPLECQSIRLVYLENKPVPKAAEIMELSAAEVRKLNNKALRKLRARLIPKAGAEEIVSSYFSTL